MHQAPAGDKKQATSKVSDSNKTKFMHALQINTVEAGYNAGRAYYFKAPSQDVCHEIVSSLQTIARDARKRTESWSWFRRLQRRTCAVHDSTPFQLCVAFLIVAVGCRTTQWFCHACVMLVSYVP
jgi:hypothetical protein